MSLVFESLTFCECLLLLGLTIRASKTARRLTGRMSWHTVVA